MIPGPAAAEPLVLHVDPVLGADLEGRGTSELPFRTATYAIARAEEDGLADLEVRLAPGVYREAQGDEPGERFPLRLPPTVARLIVTGGRGGAHLIAGDPASPVLELEVYGAGRQVEVRLERLEIRGGLAGACFAAGTGGNITGRIADCAFSGQSGKAIEAFIASGATARIEVMRTLVEGTGGGIAIETAASCVADLLVKECILRSIASHGPGGFLGSGVEAHLDPRGRLAVNVLGNVFWDLASAVQLTASEEDEEAVSTGGALEALVAGNLVGGVPALGEPPVKNGIYLSLWPHHDVSLIIASNAFVGIAEHVIHHDNLEALRDRGAVIPWTFANNIAWGIGAASEFDGETAGSPFPPAGIVVRSNILEKSALGRDGTSENLASDPRFTDETAGDYHLRADSPARDRGDASFADLIAVDLDGRCRAAAGSCPPPGGAYPIDIGPFEFPGFCERDVFVFRRGDCNASKGSIEITDAIFTFGVLFLGEGNPPCEDACDTNDDGKLNIADGISTLMYLFVGGDPIPPPAGEGADPTRDCLEPCY